MSFYTYYQAMPEGSRLLELLRTKRELCALYTRLMVYGGGPFHLDRLDPDELDDILDGIAEAAPFGSRAEVDASLYDLREELAHAVTAHPGLEKRAAYIEKLHREIEGALSDRLRSCGTEADVELMKELLYGGDALAPAFFGGHERPLSLVRASSVARGAKTLAGIELSEEDDNICDYTCEQYKHWKSFIIETAEVGEAVSVLPAP
jgi:hypothetical protein